MKTFMTLTYASSLTDLCRVNSSFDSGVLRVAYTGLNRNGSFISKDTFERCLKTIFNCPVVCNYNRETDSFGGHDIELVVGADGEYKVVNSTVPVGCVPESARVWWETVTEDDGSIHEYLYTDVLLWKRQEPYEKIKKDGITAHSMEISVVDGEMKDGVYYINDFEFTAFALIGVEPCFESSALEVFATQDFKWQYAEMMRELKESYSSVDTSNIEVDIHPQHSTEGGEAVLDEKMELVAKYNIAVEDLDFSLEDFTVEELTEKFEAMTKATEEIEEVPTEDQNDDQFSLTSNVLEELYRVLEQETVSSDWGEHSRYYYVDCDFESQEVYCWDCTDWLLYGFAYTVDGDSVTIDYESKKRKKYVIADFDEGEQASPFGATFEAICAKYNETKSRVDELAGLEDELNELRAYKANIEKEIATKEREAVFALFEDLNGTDAFEELKENSESFSAEELAEKCYAIRGRLVQNENFSLGEPKQPKLKIDTTDTSDEPYGDLFVRYGNK